MFLFVGGLSGCGPGVFRVYSRSFRVCARCFPVCLMCGSVNDWVLLILTLTVRGVFLNLKRLFWVVKFSLCARSMFVLCPFNPFLLPCCLFILCFVRCVLRAYLGFYEHIRWFTSIFGVYPLCVKTRQEGSGMCLEASGVHLGCF